MQTCSVSLLPLVFELWLLVHAHTWNQTVRNAIQFFSDRSVLNTSIEIQCSSVLAVSGIFISGISKLVKLRGNFQKKVYIFY